MNQLHNYFHNDAEVYDAINDFDLDLKFWKKWCKKGGKSLLELCCGTGRIGIPLIKSGFNYTGIDLSKEFLSSFKEKTKSIDGSYEIKIKDIRSFDLNKKFHSIIIPFNSFSHLYTYKDVEKCFNSVKKHMYKNSVFIIDIFNPKFQYFIRDDRKKHFYGKYKTASGRLFKLYEKNKYDRDTQINHLKWHYEFLGKAKGIKIDDLFMRVYYPQEILALLEHNGFEIIKRFGNYDESRFNSDSHKHIIVVKKLK